MQAFIDFLIRNLLELWPIARIDEWETGIRVRCGHIRETLTPGLHWRWLFVDKVITWWSTEMSCALATGCVTCTSGESVVVGANVRYRVDDYAKAKRTIFDLTATLKRNLVGMICSEVASRSWTELSGHRADFEKQLMAVVGEQAERWGLFVTAIDLTDLARTKPLHHTSDGTFFVQGSSNS